MHELSKQCQSLLKKNWAFSFLVKNQQPTETECFLAAPANPVSWVWACSGAPALHYTGISAFRRWTAWRGTAYVHTPTFCRERNAQPIVCIIICKEATYTDWAHMLSDFSHVWLFVTFWTVVLQDPLFMGFSRQEYWSGLLCPPPGDLPRWGIKPIFVCLLHW